jgi:glycosyltransferase involved in cell wall biosynthesis
VTSTGRWKVASIELSEGVPELGAVPDFDGVYAVFLWCGIALGHARYASDQLPLTSKQLAVSASLAISPAVGNYIIKQGFQTPLPGLPSLPLEHPDVALHELLSMPRPLDCLSRALLCRINPTPALSVSVAICTRNRPRELQRCIESVLGCSESPLEIIVLDNAPETDATRELVSRFPQIRYHKEPRKGLSTARNTALAIATGDIVAFADDDVVVSPNWISNLRKPFIDSKVLVATGLVLPAELETSAQRMFEDSLQYFHKGYCARRFDSSVFEELRSEGVPVWLIGAGANMAIRRDAFRMGYRFDTRLGPGVFGGCGEDSAYWYSVLAEGWTCAYDPSFMVYHYHRRDLKSLRRLVRQYMQGHVAALFLQYFLYKHRGNLKRIFWALPRGYVTLLQPLIMTGFSPECRILFSGVLGWFSGLRFAFVRKERSESQ